VLAMWHRNEAQPTIYNGVEFRSALEARVAEQLDGFNVLWVYEEPSGHPAVPYLPDFTIVQATTDLDLPRWVEVKPGELLYAIRDKAGLPERFDEPVRLAVTAANLESSGFVEAAKPKALAEAAGEPVLVVSAINRTRTLAVLMAPDHVVLTRSHPAVCWQQILKDAERKRQQAQWAAEAEQRRVEREAAEGRRIQDLLTYVRTKGRNARYDGCCWICRQEQPAADLVIFPAERGYGAICRGHLTEAVPA
jgi:hypothetical protein